MRRAIWPVLLAVSLGIAAAYVSRVGIDALLDWAEHSYPSLFPAGAASQTMVYEATTYAARAYVTTGNYLGVDPVGDVWGLGAFTGQLLRSFGHIDEFSCLVDAALCVPPVPPRCAAAVRTGFEGDLNAEYPGASGGEGGDSGDGGGSAGVGGSEGKVLGGLLRVFRLSDGVLLGEAFTDSALGLATVHWCASDLPVMLELRGAPGARYFDEAKNTTVEFAADQRLRALVDRFDENIGLSALTEAAYLWAMNNVANDPRSVTAGARALVTEGIPLGLAAAQVRQANALVLGEMNRHFIDGLQQPSMKALATPIDQRSGRDALPRNRYGRMAALTGGLAKVAGSYAGDSPAPALAASMALSRDLTDGQVDGIALDGKSTLASAERGYSADQRSAQWALGYGIMGAAFGRSTLTPDGENYVYYNGVFLSPQDRDPACPEERDEEYFALSKYGTLSSNFRKRVGTSGCDYATGIRVNILGDVLALPSTGHYTNMYAVMRNGSVVGWGDENCGTLATDAVESSYVTEGRVVAGLSNITTVTTATLTLARYALDNQGRVFTWGEASDGMLGLGDSPATGICVRNNMRDFPFTGKQTVDVVRRPTQVAGLERVVQFAIGPSAFALDAGGSVYQWGSSLESASQQAESYPTRPQKLDFIASVKAISATRDAVFALGRDGTVRGWGPNHMGALESTGAPVRRPVLMPGVSDVTEIASDGRGVTVALRRDGTVLMWWGYLNGGIHHKPPTSGNQYPVFVQGRLQPDPLPRIVRLTMVWGMVSALGADGHLYQPYFYEEYGPILWSRQVIPLPDVPPPE